MITTGSSYYLVIGLGASGLSMARFLRSQGKEVVATDIDPKKTDVEAELNAIGIKTQIGYHDQKTFNNAAFLVPSPGIPLTSPYIATALQKGVPLTCELDIFSQANQLPVIAVTGTNGKTTTTTLIGELLSACKRRPFVGGNIGTPLLEQLMSGQDHDIIVAEISSFQIDLSRSFTPDVGLLLNVSEDHLDRYEDFKNYEDSKWRLFASQSKKNTAIINTTIKGFNKRIKNLDSAIIGFSSAAQPAATTGAVISDHSIRIRLGENAYEIDTGICPRLFGIHNHENMTAAVLASLSVGCDIDDIKKGLAAFNALPHRMERVAVINGTVFYNDSKATNTDAVIRALECFDHSVILILGGREKGTDFTQLVPAVRQRVKAIMSIGESSNKIKQVFDPICPVVHARDMKEAVNNASKMAVKDDTVLLSPACASFDMYDNYAHRGDEFKSIVKEMEAKSS